jgi:hypothetical protein
MEGVDKALAEDALKRVSEAEKIFINIMRDLYDAGSPEEKEIFKKGLGNGLINISEAIHKPLWKKFPELIPPDLRPKDGGQPYMFR